ncbi:hypothetical protein RUM44_000186 [Polyplax serrata]|uniref:Uncharacterized protein n=1 Tax=Polyplax serrata TaxID=468196 RepID=A0ABR1B4S5_POLSC
MVFWSNYLTFIERYYRRHQFTRFGCAAKDKFTKSSRHEGKGLTIERITGSKCEVKKMPR